MPEHFAFISYSHRTKPWTETLHANLEKVLPTLGEPRKIFLDQVDLGPGQDWAHQLQRGLATAEKLVLVATPESIASLRVIDEWHTFLTRRADWVGNVFVVLLQDVPLPPFLQKSQYLDFRSHNERSYLEELGFLTAGLRGQTDRRHKVELPDGLTVPRPPTSTLPGALRAQAVEVLAPVCALGGPVRRTLEFEFDLQKKVLERHPSPECQASTFLVLTTGDDDPLTAAIRTVEGVLKELAEDLGKYRKGLSEVLARLVGHRDREMLNTGPAGLVGAWLHKVIGDHEALVPYFQQKSELALLDRVFVQLAIRREQPEPSLPDADPERLRSGLEPMKVREVLELAPEETRTVAKDLGGRWVILGDPGAGKTTLLRHLAAELARETRPQWIPVFESLPRLMREREWFLDRIERLMGQGGPAQGLAAVLTRTAEEGRLLLLLDGLDEVPSEARSDAEALLRRLSLQWPKTPIVVTSRPIGFRLPGKEFRELQLLAFDAERRHEFLARWFGRADGKPRYDQASRAAAALEADPSLRELASNPLYLTLMALLIEQSASPATNRAKLYSQVFELLLDGKHRPEPQPMDCQEAVRMALRFVAFEMTRENRDAEPVTQIEARLYQPEGDDTRDILERTPRWKRGLRPFLDDLAERTGILGPHDGPDTEWRFWHRTFREALAAEELAARFAADGREAVLDHARSIAGDESRWAEPYALLTGQVDDPDTLVKALVKENQALGLRALATAQTLADETIVEVLELSDDPDERAEVYLRLPELVDDPSRLLPLIDRLRRRTRNGDDLYHLDLLCEILTRRHSEHAAAAQALRSRLYDHIPAPPEGLFEIVETRDGIVDLWCEIPTGEFPLGSPKEEHAWEGERVPYQATLKQQVRLAAVPVTQAQYRAFDPKHSSGFEGEDRPVERVSWWAAMAFCRWLASHPATSGARLPTEEEWEIACRAGTTTRYWSSDEEKDLDRVGWYDENSGGETHPVGRKPANRWGLYDVHGNVWEWAASPWSDPDPNQDDLAIDPSQVDPADLTPDMPTSNQESAGSADASADLAETRRAGRVIRGGSCVDTAQRTRSAFRSGDDPWARNWILGFRVLMPLASPRS